MQCITPITLVRKVNKIDGSRTDVVPCGKCPHCLRTRQAGWIFRLNEEQKQSKTSCFITLTYEDDHLPFSEKGYPTLKNKDFQSFMKRLRKPPKHLQLFQLTNVRYYAIGEYGSESYRPHYHAIMFNLPKSYVDYPEILQSIWTHGYVHVAECNVKTIAYTTKYMMKTFTTDGRHPDDDRQRERLMASNGLGKSYLNEKRKTFYHETQTPYIIGYGGQKISMPRYYKEKIFSKLERQQMAKEFETNYINPYQSAKQELEHKQYIIDEHKKKQQRKKRNTI